MLADLRSNTWLTLLVLAAAAIAFGYQAWGHPMDFRVYHFGARGVFDGTRPVYGQSSGLGWPMHYRYPPLFLLLFAPLAAIPLGPAAALWVAAKIVVLALLLRAILVRKPNPTPRRKRWYLISFVFMAPYIVEELRYGNAQFFVVALTIGALLVLRDKVSLAAASLGLAISIKVWPIFFVPYLAIRREWKMVAYTLGFAVFLALLPSLYFGFAENLDLLGQWFNQEFRTQLGESEIWFPNQSLRGVLMRYLTVIDYVSLPDPNYVQVNVVAMDSAMVRLLWILLAAGLYVGFLVLVHRRRDPDAWLDHALAFCLLALLQPFTQKYALVVLLWPAILAAGLMEKTVHRILIISAAALVVIQPLVPGATAQRLLQVLGMDFAAVLLLTIVMALSASSNRSFTFP